MMASRSTWSKGRERTLRPRKIYDKASLERGWVGHLNAACLKLFAVSFNAWLDQSSEIVDASQMRYWVLVYPKASPVRTSNTMGHGEAWFAHIVHCPWPSCQIYPRTTHVTHAFVCLQWQVHGTASNLCALFSSWTCCTSSLAIFTRAELPTKDWSVSL